MSKINFVQKAGLVFFGIFLSVVAVEVVLRLGGFIFVSYQSYQNRKDLTSKDQYRILCIGESTTALGGDDSYPSQLERILNERRPDVSVKVINKGLPATVSSYHAKHLQEYLDAYQPDVVVSMLGINDEIYLADQEQRPRAKRNFLSELRVYKFFSLLKDHLFLPETDSTITRELELLKGVEDKLQNRGASADYMTLGVRYRNIDAYKKAVSALLKAVKRDPANYQAWGYLGLTYKQLVDYPKAAEAFTMMLKVCPLSKQKGRQFAYAHLANIYTALEDYDAAEELYQDLLAEFPDHPDVLGRLGELYVIKKDYVRARALLTLQIDRFPESVEFYAQLAQIFDEYSRPQQGVRLFEEAVRINPESARLYLDFGTYLLKNKEYEEAQAVLEDALVKSRIENSDDEEDLSKIRYHLIASYEGQGKDEQAERLRHELLAGSRAYTGTVADSYRKIKDILKMRKIPLVAVQYPMRDIQTLKESLGSLESIILVENKTNFQEVVTADNYYDYFSDRFAGNFGHCTPKGNYILASNVAEVLLNQFFDWKKQ